MSAGKLLLHPPLDAPLPDLGALEKHLREIQLIGSPLDGREKAFLAGERFMRLVTFMGCSPYLRMEPENEQDKDFCHLRFSADHTDLVFRSGKNTRPPNCPNCKQRLTAWPEMMQQWTQQGHCHCPECHSEVDPTALRWRQNAGFGRFFIEIFSVFPSEAIPSPELLQALQDEDGEWGYFYIQE